MTGNGAANVLAGATGDDTLIGGAGADHFVFRTGDGTDTITDFTIADGDVIDLRGVIGVHKLSDLAITQNGTDTVITLGSGIVLQNFVKEALAPEQFLFSQRTVPPARSSARSRQRMRIRARRSHTRSSTTPAGVLRSTVRTWSSRAGSTTKQRRRTA